MMSSASNSRVDVPQTRDPDCRGGANRVAVPARGATSHAVKNGPDALEMGCLFYPRKQTSASFAATVIGGMTQAGKVRTYARCRTFVPATWLKPDQKPLPRAADVQQTVALDLWQWDKIGEGTASAGIAPTATGGWHPFDLR
jgi:hypothetical protein